MRMRTESRLPGVPEQGMQRHEHQEQCCCLRRALNHACSEQPDYGESDCGKANQNTEHTSGPARVIGELDRRRES